MNSPLLSKAPILRLLVPLILGIIIGETFPASSLWLPIGLGTVAIAIFIAMQHDSNTPLKSLQFRPYYIIPIALASIALGWSSQHLCQPAELNLKQINGKEAYGRVLTVAYKEQSMEMEVLLLSEGAQNSRIRITTKGCNYKIIAGDLVDFEANLSIIQNTNTPEEIDFSTILRRRGILYEQHIDAKKINKYGHEETLSSKMASIRNRLQISILNSNLSNDAKHFVVSLILGDKKFIDSDTRYEYSCAGVAHILALSGLHIGILVLLIWWILKPLDYIQLKKARFIITILAIAVYDLLSGMSPSVIRSSIMIGFTFASYIFFRKSTPINALLAAALLILVFSPTSLYDVGFQLSFITVGTLLLLSPQTNFDKKKNKSWQYVKATIITSVIAMFATIALTAYYFHTTSWISVLSNLMILPLFPVFMIAGALVVIFASMGIEVSLIDSVINLLVNYFNSVAHLISNLPFSHTDNIYITGWEVSVYYLFFALAIIAIIKKKWTYGIASCATLAISIILHTLLWIETPKEGIVLFNSYTSTPIFYYTNGIGYIWAPDDKTPVDVEEFKRYHKGFIACHNIDSISLLGSDTIKVADCLFKPPYAYIKGNTFMIAGKNKWKKLESIHKVDLDYCIVTSHFHGKINDLERLYNIKNYVLSGNIYQTNEEPLISQCDSLNVKYASVKNGAIYIPTH